MARISLVSQLVTISPYISLQLYIPEESYFIISWEIANVTEFCFLQPLK
jgi:hypothetical protein